MSKRSKTRTKDSTPLARPDAARRDAARPELAQSKCGCGASAGVTGECAECASKKLTIDRRLKDDGAHAAAPPSVDEVVRSSGQPLDAETRKTMESRFGHDFSRVRVHTDERAAESASEVNAIAYTIGQDVVFAQDKYSPDSREGQTLLAHELAHTVQQSHAASHPGTASIGARDSALEREADRAAEGWSRGTHIGAMTASGASLQKKDPTPEEIAATALKTGLKDRTEQATFTKQVRATEKVEKAGTKITRVEIPLEGKDEIAREMTSTSAYEAEFRKCPSARAEDGLPKAFLCTTQSLTPANVRPDDDATLDTNVRVAFKEDKGGGSGSTWVVSASLPWVLNTAAFLDTSVIDVSM